MPHRVEGEKVLFFDVVGVAEEFEAGFEDAGFRVLEGRAHAEDSPAEVAVEVDSFGDFAARDAEQDRALAVLAGGAVGLEREGGFLGVGGLDEEQLVVPDLVEDAHALPHADDHFHVEVGGEEDDEAVGGDLGEFEEETAVVADHARVGADLEAGGDGLLVGAAGDDHGEEGAAGEGHRVGFLGDGGEVEHFRVHFEWGDGAGGDDDGGEAFEDRFDGDGCVEAGEVEHWVGNLSLVGFVGFEDE